MQFLVTLVQLSFLLRVIWQNVEGLAKKPTSGTLDTIWGVTGTKLPVLPVPPGHPVSKQNADACLGAGISLRRASSTAQADVNATSTKSSVLRFLRQLAPRLALSHVVIPLPAD